MIDDIGAIAELGGAAAIEMVASTLADRGAPVAKCPNCGAPMIGAYCAVCGQERDTHRRSVWRLLHNFFEEIVSFDSRILRTARALVLQPGELPLAFQEGRPRSYVPALRLYLFVSLIFFLTLSAAGIALMQFEITAKPLKLTRDAQGNYYIANPADDPSDPDTRAFRKVLQIPNAKATRPGGVFSYSSKTFFFSPIGRIDSALPAAARRQLAEDEAGNNFIDEGSVAGKMGASKAEQARARSLGTWIKKSVYGGIARVVADPAAINGSLTLWIPRLLFLLLPLYALLLALFYWRKRKSFYFVDHLVFSLAVHTFFFVVLIADIALVQFLSGDFVAWLSIAALGLYILLAMKRFYRQGWFWTTTKFALVSFVYTIFFLLPALAGAVVLGFLGVPLADAFDVIVIGSGPAGYVCAIRASQLGLRTAIVERDRLGGICLNWGCIPTKALLRSSEIWHLMHRLNEFGFSADNFRFDIAKIVERSRKVSAQLSNGVAFLMKKNKIAVLPGEAKLAGAGKITVSKDGKTADYTAKNIVLATGARARSLPGLEPDGKLVWTYMHAMVPAEFPKSLLVVGSGAIGIEFASFYRTLGSEVTVVELLDRVLPVEDEEISQFAAKAFIKQGMKIRTSTTVEKLEKGEANVTATLKTKDGRQETLTVDRVILAVGIVGNVENIGLEQAGVKIEKTHVVVDKWGETGVDGIHAIGDLVGPPWLAHKGMHEGVIVAERIAGVKSVHPLDVSKVPGCTYCWPQVASVGLTEAAAKASGRKVKVGHFPFLANGKAIALGDPDGLVKTVFDAETGELLGAHMIGAEVTELIQGYTIARTLESTEAELAATIFPHPTLSEMMHEAVLDADKRALHI